MAYFALEIEMVFIMALLEVEIFSGIVGSEGFVQYAIGREFVQ